MLPSLKYFAQLPNLTSQPANANTVEPRYSKPLNCSHLDRSRAQARIDSVIHLLLTLKSSYFASPATFVGPKYGWNSNVPLYITSVCTDEFTGCMQSLFIICFLLRVKWDQNTVDEQFVRVLSAFIPNHVFPSMKRIVHEILEEHQNVVKNQEGIDNFVLKFNLINAIL